MVIKMNNSSVEQLRDRLAILRARGSLKYLELQNGSMYKMPDDPIMALGIVRDLANSSQRVWILANWLEEAIEKMARARGWTIPQVRPISEEEQL
jgi:hypothetical protein